MVFIEGLIGQLNDFDLIENLVIIRKILNEKGKFVLRDLISPSDSVQTLTEEQHLRPVKILNLLLTLAGLRIVFMELSTEVYDDGEKLKLVNYILEKDD